MMKNSKKVISMSIAAALSAVIFITTAMAASNNVSGYEKVKESAFRLYALSNYSIKAGYDMREDGVEFVSGSFSANLQDEDNIRHSASITLNGKTFTSEYSTNDGATVTKNWDSDTYRTYSTYSPSRHRIYSETTDGDETTETDSNHSIRSRNNFKSDRTMTDNEKKLISVIFDMFAGDTKNYFTNNDGRISVKLERSQIPEFFQALLSVASDQASQIADTNPRIQRMKDNHFGSEDSSAGELAFFGAKMLNVINGMAVESVYAQGYIDEDGLLNDAQLSFTISGKDDDGNQHEITTNVNYVISDVGTTKAEPIDLTGKEISEGTTVQEIIDGDRIIRMENGMIKEIIIGGESEIFETPIETWEIDNYLDENETEDL